MRHFPLTSRPVFPKLLLSFALLILSMPTFAQPPAETCGAGDSLGISDMLPVDLSFMPATDDFEMTGTGCLERGVDHVTCFVPTNNCTVDVICSDADGFAGSGEILGIQPAANVTVGACSTTPASCLDSAAGTGVATISNLALTGGTRYCVVCEIDFPLNLRAQVLAVSGDCGGLPVSLQSFAIE